LEYASSGYPGSLAGRARTPCDHGGVAPPVAPVPEASPGYEPIWPIVAFAVYIAGVVVLVVRLLWGWRCAAQIAQTSERVEWWLERTATREPQSGTCAQPPRLHVRRNSPIIRQDSDGCRYAPSYSGTASAIR